MQSHAPSQLQRYLSSAMLSLCFLLGGIFFTPATTKAATLYTDFTAWAANAGTITNTSQFDWYEYGGISYPALMFTLAEGTTWEFADSTPRSLLSGEQPHDGFGNYLWGGNPDAHAFSAGLRPIVANPITLQIELPNDIVAGGVWITVRAGADLHFTFAGIEDPLVLGTMTTQFVGWVGQDMTAIEISLIEFVPGFLQSGDFFIGDFFEGTGPTPVPEPGPLLLLALGSLALLAARRTPWVGRIRPA